jgi:hypothetical protein
MAIMNSSNKPTRQHLTEDEIDAIVESQANADSAWGKSVKVRKAAGPTSVSIPADLAASASFLARLHREKTVEDWLTRVIKERVELEETAFGEAKREISRRNGV